MVPLFLLVLLAPLVMERLENHSSFHFVPHFEECSPGVTIKLLSSYFGNFIDHFLFELRPAINWPLGGQSLPRKKLVQT
jgi:hypothetical protein